MKVHVLIFKSKREIKARHDESTDKNNMLKLCNENYLNQ